MLTGIHFLLTYTCSWECDHCFLFCSPRAEGTFTLAQIRRILKDAKRIPTLEWVYFEGGEPTLYYPLLVEGVRIAGEKGFRTGIVTNAYWATCVEDAKLWLRPFAELGLDDLSLSDDEFHYEAEQTPAQRARIAAEELGMPTATLCIERPTVERTGEKGAPVVGGGGMLRGRAAEKLVEDLPTRPAEELTDCPYEDLESPGRVHLDAFGHVHLCQGLSLGNLWETPLSELVAAYDATEHPISGPLVRGGPPALAREYGVDVGTRFVDECHYCFLVRKALRERFDKYLAPPLVYGLEEESIEPKE